MSRADINYRSFGGETDLRLDGVVIDPRTEGRDPAQFADLLKFSRCLRVFVTNLTVAGGGRQLEDAVDLNNECEDVTIENASLEAGRNTVTIKGGCRNITLAHVMIEHADGPCDIDLGNWSDQSLKPTTGVVLTNVTRRDGKKVRVRVGHAARPRILGGNVEILFWASLGLKAYWWTKWCYAQVFRSQFPKLFP